MQSCPLQTHTWFTNSLRSSVITASLTVYNTRLPSGEAMADEMFFSFKHCSGLQFCWAITNKGRNKNPNRSDSSCFIFKILVVEINGAILRANFHKQLRPCHSQQQATKFVPWIYITMRNHKRRKYLLAGLSAHHYWTGDAQTSTFQTIYWRLAKNQMIAYTNINQVDMWCHYFAAKFEIVSWLPWLL